MQRDGKKPGVEGEEIKDVLRASSSPQWGGSDQDFTTSPAVDQDRVSGADRSLFRGYSGNV